MPSLTHIKMFSDHGWKRITALEAAEIFPNTVPASRRKFMCELCHQYVYFSKPGKQARHFGHTPEADKSCPERTFKAGANTDCDSREHDLPIRLKLLPKNSPSDFEFELGLLEVPASTLNALQDQKILIHPIQNGKAILPSYLYVLKDRLCEDKVSYVSIGQVPFPEYQIELECRKNIRGFPCWPERIRGIDPSGTLFDALSCKKLPYDADVQVGKDYYLLCTNRINHRCNSVSLKQIFVKPFSSKHWYLYRVSAAIIDENAARFFLQYHCRLTDQPVSIQPIWPLYIRSPYVVRHNSQEMVFYVRGDVSTQYFPSGAYKNGDSTAGGKLEYVRCRTRQQLISVGHSYKLSKGDLWRRLKYTYLWQEPLDHTTELPSISVTDFSGQTISPGKANKLPPKNILRICTPYDGLLIVTKNGKVVEKRRIKAGITSEFDSIQFDCELKVFQGLDCVWSIQYQRESSQPEQNETQLLLRLKNGVGPPVTVPHAWGAVAAQLDAYPQIKRWLYQKIREGSMPMAAYREFKHLMIYLMMKS